MNKIPAINAGSVFYHDEMTTRGKVTYKNHVIEVLKDDGKYLYVTKYWSKAKNRWIYEVHTMFTIVSSFNHNIFRMER